MLVGRFQPFGDLSRDGQRLLERHRSLGDAVGKGPSVDQLEDQRPHSVGLFQAMNDGNVGMVHGGKDLGLSLEPAESLRVVGKKVGQHFEGNFTTELGVASSVDFALYACGYGPSRSPPLGESDRPRMD